jgi:Domain of unknown function (DUF4440)
MNPAAMVLPDLERTRLRALVDADVETAGPLHAEDYQLVTPNGSEMTKDDYLGAIGSGELRYRVFEAASEIAVLGDGPVAVLRYLARISFDDRPGLLCWHTDCYRRRDGRWQVAWSQATRIIRPS